MERSPVKEENKFKLSAHAREYARNNGDEILGSIGSNETQSALQKGSRQFDSSAHTVIDCILKFNLSAV